jgi:hypothetical protein
LSGRPPFRGVTGSLRNPAAPGESVKEDGRTRKALPPDVMGLRGRFNMSGHSDSIRERRAREVRVWREEEDAETTTETKAVWGSLGLLVAQRFQNAEEQAEVIQRICSGRLSLEYILWNGRTDVILPTDDAY